MKSEVHLGDGLLLSGDHALFMPESGVLAISDLHIGYEASLQAQAVAIPDFQLDIMLERLERLLDRYSPRRVVINGDLKHEFSRNRGQEWDEIGKIVDTVRDSGAELTVVRGNHDNYLKTILARKNVDMPDYHPEGGAIFAHGHKGVGAEERGLTVYGHEHPVVRIRDEIGAMITMPCFLHSAEHNFLILVAFSPLASGTNVISPTDNWMIPALRGLNVSGARIYTISENAIMDFGTVEAVASLNFQS